MNVGERETILNVLRQLNPETTRGSDKIKEGLKQLDSSCWLSTWIIPALELLVLENRSRDDLRLAQSLSSPGYSESKPYVFQSEDLKRRARRLGGGLSS